MCWLIPGPEGPAIPARQLTFLPVIQTWSWRKKKRKNPQTFMFDDLLLGCHWWRVTRTYESSSSEEKTSSSMLWPTAINVLCLCVGCPLKVGYSPVLVTTKVNVVLSSSVSCLQPLILQVLQHLCPLFSKSSSLCREEFLWWFIGSSVRWGLRMAFCWSQGLEETNVLNFMRDKGQ